ncbi:uncharacterized protein LOC104899181 [Beta vulgaris subsp. vulgaris]|uniref:uncharacterized protein LOC104899181 n=1 Tax=Beta vulgaris subsp. vulgaris TaxID=3555 RepID=UPI0005400FAE|nr:uncharacterized protein LOC104899181 [Beta vulgaris subsp. vulgaris]
MTGDYVRVQWDKLVWNRLTVPKHRFFMWLIMLDRLQTSARLCKYGISERANCLICDREEENQDHLIIQCKYSMAIWKMIMKWLQINSNHYTTDGMTRWLQRCRASKFKRQVYIAIMAAGVYHIWLTRNEVLWDKKVVSVDVLVNRIQRVVVDRVYSVIPKKINKSDREWLRIITQHVARR